MKKNTVLYAALAGLLLSTGSAFAQQGMGTNNPHKTSVLDMQSDKRGLLVPRLGLTATDNPSPIVDTPAQSLLVYNTETKGTGATAVKPGYYYWEDAKWNRVVNVQEATDIAVANDNDTKVSTFTINSTNGLQLTFTDGTSKSVSIAELKAAIDTNTTYNGSTSVVLNSGSFERAALTGDVSAAQNVNSVTVKKIQGKAVSNATPNAGQVLQWDATTNAWTPTTPTDNDTQYQGSTSVVLVGNAFKRAALTGDVTAAQDNNTVTVTKIQGKSVATTAPTTGQVLRWDGSAWTPANPSLTSEVDGVIGNEVTNATTDKGLVRAGAGTATSPYTLGLVDGTAAGQVMKWNGSKWAPAADADTSSKVTSGTVSGNSLTLQQDGGASPVVIDVSTLATDVKVSSAALDTSNILTLTKSDNTTVTVDLSALATDTNTQSRETVSAGTGITVTPTGGADNKDFKVAITPAGAGETKILGSTNGAVAWVDVPSSSGGTLQDITGNIRVVSHITQAEWTVPGTFALVQTGTDAFQLPPAANYTGKIISINNQGGQPVAYATPAPKNWSSLTAGMGHLLMSDGTDWYIIGGSY